jgi:hypothetical protein
MTQQEIEDWFKKFDETKDTFKWFWDQYFPGRWDKLLSLREEKNWNSMMNEMNDVWFWLPDGRFNIMENPAGWKEFLYLIES